MIQTNTDNLSAFVRTTEKKVFFFQEREPDAI